jgi:hypothetical protein
MTKDVPESSPPVAEEPRQKHVYHFRANGVSTAPPELGRPSLGELRHDPLTGEIIYFNLAQRRKQTARARQTKNEIMATRRREIPERHALALWTKNRTRKGNAEGTMKEIAEAVLNDLKAEDPRENRTFDQVIAWAGRRCAQAVFGKPAKIGTSAQ